jgi:hypothetical protein
LKNLLYFRSNLSCMDGYTGNFQRKTGAGYILRPSGD